MYCSDKLCFALRSYGQVDMLNTDLNYVELITPAVKILLVLLVSCNDEAATRINLTDLIAILLHWSKFLRYGWQRTDTHAHTHCRHTRTHTLTQTHTLAAVVETQTHTHTHTHTHTDTHTL